MGRVPPKPPQAKRRSRMGEQLFIASVIVCATVAGMLAMAVGLAGEKYLKGKAMDRTNYLAEPIIGHEQNHWQVVEQSPTGMDIPRCETSCAEWAWKIAALLNNERKAGEQVLRYDDTLMEEP